MITALARAIAYSFEEDHHILNSVKVMEFRLMVRSVAGEVDCHWSQQVFPKDSDLRVKETSPYRVRLIEK